MSQRIKGQEIEIVMTVDGAPQENLTNARSLEFAFKTELIQEGYIGETTDQYDTIFKGISGRIEFHMSNPEAFNIVARILEKARSRQPGTRFNVKVTLNFPNGARVRVIIPDVEFGELPFAFGSRADYGTFNIEFGASEAQVLPQAA